MPLKILVADDEPNIREVVGLYLKQEGFIIYSAADGREAVDLDLAHKPDLLILDIMLPKLSGWEVCRLIERNVPIIFLTAKGTEEDKMTGFSLGADDYITKPFSPKELVARVKAVLRRGGLLLDSGQNVTFPGLEINPAAQTAACSGNTLPLSPKEYDLLYFLARHPKQVFTREQLLLNVWGYDFEGDDRTVDTTVKRLRQKMANSQYSYIHTAWGKGYKFEVLAL